MGEVITSGVLFGSALVAWAYFLRGPDRRWFRHARSRLLRLATWCGLRQPPPPPPLGRPLEAIAADVRRLAPRYRCPQAGTRFAKIEGCRRAYDAVLVEACGALGMTCLLGVLRPGEELDAERERVEDALVDAGMSLGAWR